MPFNEGYVQIGYHVYLRTIVGVLEMVAAIIIAIIRSQVRKLKNVVR